MLMTPLSNSPAFFGRENDIFFYQTNRIHIILDTKIKLESR